MCCFSRSVRQVSKTRIYARPVELQGGSRQLLIYSMKLAADEDVAMVLPIPVPPSSPEDVVRFVDMSSCPAFFDEVDAFFPDERARGFGPPPQGLSAPKPAPMLVVHDVGDFEASFVPTRQDFERLDPRFRLPENVFQALPQYRDWGFCVFKLRAAPRGAPRDYHPMAFEFPRRDPSRGLFFPTVHVHDGVVHHTARFDHQIYCQVGPFLKPPPNEWLQNVFPVRSSGPAKAWLLENSFAYRRRLSGDLPNTDVFV